MSITVTNETIIIVKNITSAMVWCIVRCMIDSFGLIVSIFVNIKAICQNDTWFVQEFLPMHLCAH